MIRRSRGALLLALASILSACASGVPGPVPAPAPLPPAPTQPPAPPPTPTQPAPPAATALSTGVVAATLPALDAQQAGLALAAFQISCPSLVRRADRSGLTQGADWQAACDAAKAVPEGGAAAFFRTQFTPVRVGDGAAFATGYFEPEIAGSRTPGPGYQAPVYRRPPDLVDVALGDFSADLAGKTIRGRVDQGKLVLYYDRGAIDDGALAGRGLEIAWAADPIELFFLQIQGSGRLRLPDGSVMRIGYDSQNGRDYVGIGRRLREMNALGPGESTMDGIVRWLRANPEPGRALMRENKSYIFFRELTGPGPVGAMGVAVTPRATVAADPLFVPLGAPVVLDMPHKVASGVWVAQDTGGAIKGANRFDTFWGAGAEAREIAGGMSSRGQAVLLIPNVAAARLLSGGAAPRP